MLRKELCFKMEDIKDDFRILKNRVCCYLKEQDDVLAKLDKLNDANNNLKSENTGCGYSFYAINDIVRDMEFIESQLNFIENNKEELLREELKDQTEELEEKIKLTWNKFKQLNIDIKEAFHFEAIKDRNK